MKKKLQLFTKTLCLFAAMLLFSSCEGDKIYEDASVIWKIQNVEIEGSSQNNRWRWDAQNKQYYCDIRIPEMTEFMYNDGTILTYVFLGTQDVDERQVLLPVTSDESGRNISSEISYDLNKTIRFKFYWDDYSNVNPGLYNFRIVFMY